MANAITLLPLKLYPRDGMEFTVFEWGREFLSKHGIQLADNGDDFDLYVCSRMPRLNIARKARYRLSNVKYKPILLWTHEPRYSTTVESILKGGLLFPDVHVMNVYTGNIYLNNYTIYGHYIDAPLNYIDTTTLKHGTGRPVVSLAGYLRQPAQRRLVVHGKDIDLSAYRQELLLRGYDRGIVDIYGKDWPNDIALEESGQGDVYQRKYDILRPYRFNICIENTDYDYYVTEKIWHSIRCYCLPIYRGGGQRIYEEFERDSFVDCAEFHSTDELCDYVVGMSDGEYVTRMNRCIETYNNICSRNDFHEKIELTMMKVVEKVHDIVGR